MVSRYSNELNSFRSGIEDRVSQHKDKLGAINQALGIKADKVFENAKKISDIGSKLTEGGIGGGVGSTALAKYARKGIDKFNTFKQGITDKAKGVVDQAESKLQEAGSKAKGLADQAESKVGELKDVAGNAESQVRQTAQNAQNSVETKAQEARDSVVSESKTEGASNQSVGGDTAEGKVNLDMDEAREGANMGAEDKNVGETNGEGTAETTSPEGEGLEIPTIKNSGVSSTADDAGEAIGTDVAEEGGAASVAVELEEGAAATSWLGFLGIPEILAAAGAVAGVAAAGIGIADAVKSGDITAKAQGMPTSAPKTGFQAAGTFVVPTMDSLS
jgi:hypothetical protein